MNDQAYSGQIRDIAQILSGAQSVLFITGAGMSAESGLPTYRGIGGLYNDRLTDDAISIEEALSGEMMQQRPEITWRYLAEIEKACRNARFNRGHQIIRELETVLQNVVVLTQNVDGFHHDAGSSNVIDIHGDIHNLLCLPCDLRLEHVDYNELQMPPLCPQCGRIMRPDVVLFGELLDMAKLQQLQSAARSGFEVVFSIGTTNVFPYIAGPVIEASRHGVPTVEINPAASEVSEIVTYRFQHSAGAVLEDIWSEVRST